MSLKESKCEACEIGAPLVTQSEKTQFLNEINDWQIKIIDDIEQLEKIYIFKSYPIALKFVEAIANMAENEGHHPKISLEWGKVQVNWWSHKIKGLHKNDFICSAKTDSIFKDF